MDSQPNNNITKCPLCEGNGTTSSISKSDKNNGRPYIKCSSLNCMGIFAWNDGEECPDCNKNTLERKEATTEKNNGRAFLTCKFCKFFQWEDQPKGEEECTTCDASMKPQYSYKKKAWYWRCNKCDKFHGWAGRGSSGGGGGDGGGSDDDACNNKRKRDEHDDKDDKDDFDPPPGFRLLQSSNGYKCISAK